MNRCSSSRFSELGRGFAALAEGGDGNGSPTIAHCPLPTAHCTGSIRSDVAASIGGRPPNSGKMEVGCREFPSGLTHHYGGLSTAARSTAPPILQLQVLLAAAGSCGDGMFLPHSGNVPLADPHAGSDFCDPGRLRAHTLASPRLPNQSGL